MRLHYVRTIKQKRTALLSLLLMLFFMPAWSQVKTVSGKVTDASNNPLGNVSVQVKGTSTGTVSDQPGCTLYLYPGFFNSCFYIHRYADAGTKCK